MPFVSCSPETKLPVLMGFVAAGCAVVLVEGVGVAGAEVAPSIGLVG